MCYTSVLINPLKGIAVLNPEIMFSPAVLEVKLPDAYVLNPGLPHIDSESSTWTDHHLIGNLSFLAGSTNINLISDLSPSVNLTNFGSTIVDVPPPPKLTSIVDVPPPPKLTAIVDVPPPPKLTAIVDVPPPPKLTAIVDVPPPPK
jgi:hypothetical protein